MQVNQPKVSAAKASTAAAHNERALFEAWVRREWPSAPLHRVRDALPVNDPRYGEYCNEILQRGWVGWQARAALAQPSPAPELKCPKVIGYACLDDIQWGGDITLRPEKSEHYSVPFAPVAQAGQVLEGMRLVPFNPTQDQWGGLARAIVFWMRSYPSNKHTPATLVEFITSLGHEVPEWMGDEAELRAQEHVISKGTIAVLIYKAMLAAAPAQGGM
ncbi:hypothetical protein [Pseudomonas aeruginosa]|uniref:hypothetical protein n=1 Tax=Pseudomonas aeruginosa TaxID=287 RepID=UPI0021F24711|nr:hypothetical protein [Pseudomonas aeruginosa]MCV6429398.1 hypothetical protein [Pseudomonas aeruginosa]MCV6437370.1 hypothetical protein [Pseudomonas aeruginosa]